MGLLARIVGGRGKKESGRSKDEDRILLFMGLHSHCYLRADALTGGAAFARHRHRLISKYYPQIIRNFVLHVFHDSDSHERCQESVLTLKGCHRTTHVCTTLLSLESV